MSLSGHLSAAAAGGVAEDVGTSSPRPLSPACTAPRSRLRSGSRPRCTAIRQRLLRRAPLCGARCATPWNAPGSPPANAGCAGLLPTPPSRISPGRCTLWRPAPGGCWPCCARASRAPPRSWSPRRPACRRRTPAAVCGDCRPTGSLSITTRSSCGATKPRRVRLWRLAVTEQTLAALPLIGWHTAAPQPPPDTVPPEFWYLSWSGADASELTVADDALHIADTLRAPRLVRSPVQLSLLHVSHVTASVVTREYVGTGATLAWWATPFSGLDESLGWW